MQCRDDGLGTAANRMRCRHALTHAAQVPGWVLLAAMYRPRSVEGKRGEGEDGRGGKLIVPVHARSWQHLCNLRLHVMQIPGIMCGYILPLVPVLVATRSTGATGARAKPLWWLADAAVFAGAHTYNLAVDGSRHAVVHLAVDLQRRRVRVAGYSCNCTSSTSTTMTTLTLGSA